MKDNQRIGYNFLDIIPSTPDFRSTLNIPKDPSRKTPLNPRRTLELKVDTSQPKN